MAAAAPSNSPSASSGATQWAEPASGPGETMESTGYATASSTMPNMPSTAEDAPSASQANIDESTTGAAGPSTGGIKVFQPAPTPQGPATPASDVDEAYFQPTLADVQAHHASVLARNKRLNEAPLLTSKHREEEREGREKRKAEKWPTTTIRIKFSDGTQVQNVFASSSPIQPVYDFVRTCLESSAQSSKFTLWQPPRFTYPEHPPPPDPSKKPKPTPSYRTQIIAPANYGLIKGSTAAGLSGGTGGRETLSELGLVPQSVLMVRWEDEGMNASGYPAPLIPELRQKAEPLPKPQPAESAQTSPAGGSGSNGPSKSGGTGEQKMPKWLAKGLMKKK